MKIRNGFVSNSSSSSFLIIGCAVPDSLETFKNLIKKELREEFEENPSDFFYNRDIEYLGTEDDGSYIGWDQDRWDYNKTINENIENVYNDLSQYINIEKSTIDVVGGTFYDG